MPPKSKSQSFDLSDLPGMSTTNRGAPESGFILVLEGLEGTGKSWLAMSGPSPTSYHSLNIGADRVIDEWREKGKTIALGEWEYDEPKFVQKKDREWWEELSKKVQANVYDPFLKSWQAGYRNDDIRVMVQDRCDEFWELAQRANFGKLQQNQQLAYGPVTDEFINPIKRAKKAGKLVILIHDLKAKYEKYVGDDGKEKSREKPGVFVRGGCRHIAGAADAIVRLHRVEEETVVERERKNGKIVETETTVAAHFDTEVILCKTAMEMNRQRFETMELPMLMAVLKPKVSAETWED
jgi:hypothetical protein